MRVAGRINGLTAAIWLASLALLLRALVPGGFMLTPSDHGRGVSIALCPGAAPVLTDSGPGEGAHGKSDAPRKTDTLPCAFAGLPTPHLAQPPASGPWFAAQGAGMPPAEPKADRHLTPRGMSAPPPPSQAPPAQRV